MNSILESIIEQRKGMYTHCVEVSTVYDLESIAEMIISEYSEYGEKEIIDFLVSLDVYFLGDEEEEEETNKQNEEKVYSFSFREYVEGTI